MSKYPFTFLTYPFLTLLFIIGCNSQNDTTSAKNEMPTTLTVEGIRNTRKVKILDKKPEYGWVLSENIKEQKGYHILVASSKENIEADKGDIWDSGFIESSKSVGITHQGNPLQAGQTYYWKVLVKYQNKSSQFSNSQSFTIAKSEGKFISTRNSFQIDSIEPVLFEKRGASYFIDFGKAAFATMIFTYETKVDTVLTIRIGEQLRGTAINRELPEKSHIRYQEIKVPVHPKQTQYVLDITPDERNTLPGKALPLPDDFPVLMPFRYAEIEGADEALSSDDFIQLAHHSYWEEGTSSFVSSDTILNQIYDLCKYSIKATTFNGLYVDGDRERIPYEADAYLNQLSHYGVDREYAMARQTIEYFMENPTWPTEWQQHVALMFYADYMYTGNTELIEKYYEQLKHKTLMELSREDGLISSTKADDAFMKKLGFKDPDVKLKDITDWPPAQKDTGWKLATKEGERDGFVFKDYNTVINSLYYQNMKIMTEFAKVLGKTDEEVQFKTIANNVKETINEKLFDSEKGYYVDGEGTDHGSIHANMMPLAFGIVPEEHKPSAVAFIKTRGMACSVYGAQYLMDGLYEAGEADYGLQLLTDTSDRSWYNMIRIGSTITLEAWDVKYKPNADWNHAWGAVPANVIPRRLWGIRPKTPGYAVASLKPQMSTLKKSSIEVPTIRGTIKASYQKEETREYYTITIPGNMIAEFEINSDKKFALHNGKKITITTEPLILVSGKHKIEFLLKR